MHQSASDAHEERVLPKHAVFQHMQILIMTQDFFLSQPVLFLIFAFLKNANIAKKKKRKEKSYYRSILAVAHYQMTVDITKALKGIKVSVIKSEGNNNPDTKDRLFLLLNFCQFPGCLW